MNNSLDIFINLVLFIIILFFVLAFICVLYTSLNHVLFNTHDESIQKLPKILDIPHVINGFITPEDAEYIKDLVNKTGGTSNSEVIGQYGKENIEKYRKSETKWLDKNSDPVVKKIINKACKLTGNHIDQCEELQVVKYGPGGFFREHNDNCCDDTPEGIEFRNRGGYRLLTILISLSDPSEFEGGETRFTKLDFSYKGDKGDAVLFYNINDNSECNDKSTHGGEPLTSGEKWIANVWIRQEKFTL
jgi:prolyl 4-hydroxylase